MVFGSGDAPAVTRTLLFAARAEVGDKFFQAPECNRMTDSENPAIPGKSVLVHLRCLGGQSAQLWTVGTARVEGEQMR